jgi:hypothetical protein
MKTLFQYNTDNRTVNLPVVDDWRYLDTLTVQVQFIPGNNIPTGAEISLALKEQSQFSEADAVVVIDNFTLDSQTGFWQSEIMLNTVPLQALFEPEPELVTLYSNLLVLVGDVHWFQGPTQVWNIQNQYTRGTEAAPSSGGGLDAFIAARAVMYDRDQSLTSGQQVAGQGNIGITWDSGSSQFIIQTPDGPKSVTGF